MCNDVAGKSHFITAINFRACQLQKLCRQHVPEVSAYGVITLL